jgi:hypothetical protein
MRTNTELREDSRLVLEVAEGTDSPQKAQPLAVEIHEAWLETHRLPQQGGSAANRSDSEDKIPVAFA